MLHSEAFASAVREKPNPDELEEIDLLRMDVPDFSPVIKLANPNVQAQVYAIVDNRFLESSNNDNLPIAQADESYTQDFSVIQQDVQMAKSAGRNVCASSSEEKNASPSAHALPNESMIEVPNSKSPDTRVVNSSIVASSFQEQTERTV